MQVRVKERQIVQNTQELLQYCCLTDVENKRTKIINFTNLSFNDLSILGYVDETEVKDKVLLSQMEQGEMSLLNLKFELRKFRQDCKNENFWIQRCY